MKFSELPIEVQEKLNAERLDLRNHQINNKYEVLLYNPSGTRYFHARCRQNSWQDNKGNYLPFGGGSEWEVKYGFTGFIREKQIIGYDYRIAKGKTYSKSANGTIIPSTVKTKKEVILLAHKIGNLIF